MMGVLVETDQSTSWIPPPKKKWIRHYLLSEVPKDYKTYAALQNNSSPPPTTNHNNNNTNRGPSLPPPPLPPPPPPPVPKNNHIYHNHLNGVSNHVSQSTTATTSSPPRRVSPTPSHYGGVHPHDGSYLAARLTAPPGDAVKNNHSQLSSPPPTSSSQSHFTPPGGGGGSGGGSSSPGDLSPHELKRRIGAGTREVHNKLEKNRRAHLKECFEMLRRQLPSSHDDKKPSNLSVLHSAIRYIQSLKRKERDYEHEMERLAREKIACQQRLSSLKKELSAQWDHIDFATLLPEAPPAPTPASTVNATSSARGSRAFDSDEDFEFEEIEEEIRRQRSTDISPQHSASTSTASERGHPSDVEDLTMSSRPGSSRDLYSSPPPPAPSLPRLIPPDQPPPQRGLPMSLAAELMRNNVNKVDVMIKSDHTIPRQENKPREDVSIKLETTEESRIHRGIDPFSTTKLHMTTPHLHLSPQLMTASGIMSATGTTIVGSAIQLLAPSLRMLSTAHDQQQGGTEINVMTSSSAPITMANNGVATLVRSPGKPINLCTSGASTASISLSNSKLATLSHPLINGSVISHAPASLHRPPLSSGGNTSSGTTVVTTMHGTPTVLGTHHHLTSATGITHLVTAGTQFSALTPLVTGPVTMVTPGSHHPGVHILATGKPPFQVVSGPLLKAHQMLPAQYLSATTTAQLMKPVMMVSSAGMPSSAAMQSVVPRASESSGSSGGP